VGDNGEGAQFAFGRHVHPGEVGVAARCAGVAAIEVVGATPVAFPRYQMRVVTEHQIID
jgi:hypothetical protein